MRTLTAAPTAYIVAHPTRTVLMTSVCTEQCGDLGRGTGIGMFENLSCSLSTVSLLSPCYLLSSTGAKNDVGLTCLLYI